MRFAPGSAGNFSNALVLATGNDGGSTNAITGTGAVVPVANFTGTPTVGLRPLAVSFSDTSTGTITNRFWDFGDGITTNTTATSVGHTYNIASTHTVTLRVIGPVGTNTLVRANYITVTNLPPELDLSPNSLSFGSVIIGQTNIQTFQVVNSGGITLTGAVSTTSPFAIQSGSSLNLAPGQTGIVSVSFAPVSAGTFSNAVIFVSNGGNSTNVLSGIGLTPPQLAVLPGSINFGTVAVGTNAQASFTLTNTGGATLSNGVASIGAGAFTILSGTPFTLPGFGSTNLVVRFAPGSAGNFSNAVVLTTGNDGASTNAVTGTGAVVPVANFTGTPTSGLRPLAVSFSDTSTGTITNRFWDFGDGITTNTTATSVGHTYNIAGTHTVTLRVTGPVGTNTLVRANYITVTNLPPELDLSPNSLSFGSVIIGQTNIQTFQVVNSGGVTLTGVVSTTAPFSIQSGSSLNLAPGQTGIVSVIFAPVSAGTFNNAVIFVSNGGNSTNVLSGVGLTPPQLAVLPGSINFGTVAVGTNAQASFTLTNTGGATLSNGVASIGAGAFTILSGTPFTLPGFGSTNLVVRFAPGSAGNFSNAVVLTTGNDGGSTNAVTGTGAVVPVANFTGTPTSGLQPLAVSFSDTSTGTITNRFWDFGGWYND